jgi:hypothetical protein
MGWTGADASTVQTLLELRTLARSDIEPTRGARSPAYFGTIIMVIRRPDIFDGRSILASSWRLSVI